MTRTFHMSEAGCSKARLPLTLGAMTVCALLGSSLPTWAQTPAEGGAGSTTPSKDVSVDAQRNAGPAAGSGPGRAAGAAPTGGRLVPTPGTGPRNPAALAGATQGQAPYTTAIHDSAAAAALADLGLALLQAQSRAHGDADINSVLSPLSVASALGLVHAGAAGESSRELAALLAPAAAGDRMFSARLPSMLQRMAAGAGTGPQPLVMAHRVWLHQGVAGNVPAVYGSLVQSRFGAQPTVLSFDDAGAARQAINQWTAQQTHSRIPGLLPAGSITPNTRVVATNAVHFRSPWATPFGLEATVDLPFHARSGTQHVPTMVSERPVLRGTVDNLSVLELPFAGRAYSMFIALPPPGHTLDALEKDLAGLDIAAWSSQLEESTCRLTLPRFAIQGQTQSLKAALQGLGVRTLFSDRADLGPMLGAAAPGVHLDDVLHAATLVIDEQGGEASAATAATLQFKSFAPPAPACPVDRPFVFAIVHKATGTPAFVGKLANPQSAAR